MSNLDLVKNKWLLSMAMSIILIMGFAQASYSQSLVPPWIKNIAKMYGDEKISEKEFINAIKYLIDKKIIILEDIRSPSDVIVETDNTEPPLIQKGVELLQSKNNEEAILVFDTVLEENTESVVALVNKGIAKARLGELMEAIQLFDMALELSESKDQIDYRVIVNGGIALSIHGEQDKAIEYLDRVIDSQDKVSEETLLIAFVNKGVALYELGKPEEAIVYFDKALELEPNHLGALVKKAYALEALKEPDKALEYFLSAYKINEDSLDWKPTFVVVI